MGVSRSYVYSVPYGTEEYNRRKDEEESAFKYNGEYKRYVLTVKSLLQDAHNKDLDKIFEEGFIPHNKLDLFSDNRKFIFNKEVTFIQRFKAEYNPSVLQLNVCCLIYDEYDNILLLKRNEGYAGCHTLVQGHVDFGKNVYIKSEKGFLLESMERELSEEITGFELNKYKPELQGYLYSMQNHNKLEHLGILYKMKIDHKDIIKIKSNETYKHSIYLTNLNTLFDDVEDSLIDVWVKLAISNILKS